MIGRFISEDLIGFGGGDINLYRYVFNTPVNITDPLGFGNTGFGHIDMTIVGKRPEPQKKNIGQGVKIDTNNLQICSGPLCTGLIPGPPLPPLIPFKDLPPSNIGCEIKISF